MRITEEHRDLFGVPSDYYLCQCISADFAMGAGIAIQFNKRFNTNVKIRQLYPNYLDFWDENGCTGQCLIVDNVLNLVTKRRYWDKPTESSMLMALRSMKYLCEHKGITKIAMPLIGCGIDKLKWVNVRKIIDEVFSDMDIEIVVCYL